MTKELYVLSRGGNWSIALRMDVGREKTKSPSLSFSSPLFLLYCRSLSKRPCKVQIQGEFNLGLLREGCHIDSRVISLAPQSAGEPESICERTSSDASLAAVIGLSGDKVGSS